MKLFGRSLNTKTEKAVLVSVHLNARYQPIDRRAYVDLTGNYLQEKGWGRLAEGEGTMLSPEGEPIVCDFDILVLQEHLEAVHAAVDQVFFMPKGSKFVVGEDERPVGQKEGLALYFYGPSFSVMKTALEEVVSRHPLCEKSRIEQIV